MQNKVGGALCDGHGMKWKRRERLRRWRRSEWFRKRMVPQEISPWFPRSNLHFANCNFFSYQKSKKVDQNDGTKPLNWRQSNHDSCFTPLQSSAAPSTRPSPPCCRHANSFFIFILIAVIIISCVECFFNIAKGIAIRHQRHLIVDDDVCYLVVIANVFRHCHCRMRRLGNIALQTAFSTSAFFISFNYGHHKVNDTPWGYSSRGAWEYSRSSSSGRS